MEVDVQAEDQRTMVFETGSSSVGSPVYLVSIFIPATVVVFGALLDPIRPDTPLGLFGREGPASALVLEADGAAKERESSSSSSAWLKVSAGWAVSGTACVGARTGGEEAGVHSHHLVR